MNFEYVDCGDANLEAPEEVLKDQLESAFVKYVFERESSIVEHHKLSRNSSEEEIEIAEMFESGKVQDAFFELRNLWDRVLPERQNLLKQEFVKDGKIDILNEIENLR